MLQIGKMALLLTILLFLHAIVVHAQTSDPVVDPQNCPTKEIVKFRGITLRIENDSLFKTDRYYTHGMVIALVSQDIDNTQTECLPLPLRWHAKTNELLSPGFWTDTESADPTHSIVVKFGQAIFTPRNRSRLDLISNDRPYAGLLYAGLSMNQRHSLAQIDLEVLDTHEIVIGVMGPWSLAKEFQDMAHDVYGDRRFNGWDHQLNNEPAAQLAMEKKIKYYRGSGTIIPGFSVDFIRSMGLRLGNIETSANLGIESRLGVNIPNDFGSLTIRPSTENRPSTTAPTADLPSGAHIFTLVEVKLIAHNFSLDGNLFSSSHQVTRRPWVGYGAVGFSVQTVLMKRGYKLSIMSVYNTREFEEQESQHAYGSVALSVEF